MYPSSRPPSQAGGRQRPGRGQGQASSAPSAPPFLELGPAPELDFGQGPGYQGRVVMGTTAFTAIAGSIKQVSKCRFTKLPQSQQGCHKYSNYSNYSNNKL